MGIAEKARYIEFEDEFLCSLKPYFKGFISVCAQNGIYDLQLGLIGLGIALLAISKKHNDIFENEINSIFEILIKSLQQIEYMDKTILICPYKMEDIDDSIQKKGTQYTNLGFLHGLPSILTYLIFYRSFINYNRESVYGSLDTIISIGYNTLMTFYETDSHYFYRGFSLVNNQVIKDILMLNDYYCYGTPSLINTLSMCHKHLPSLCSFDEKLLQVSLNRMLFTLSIGLPNNYFCHGNCGLVFFIQKFMYMNYNYCTQERKLQINSIKKNLFKAIDFGNPGYLNGYHGLINLLLLDGKEKFINRILLIE